MRAGRPVLELQADRAAVAPATAAKVREHRFGTQRIGFVGQFDLDYRAADARLELGWVPFGDDPASVNHHDAMGQAVGLVQVLRGKQHGGAVGHEFSRMSHSSEPAMRVESGGRLVQEEHRGLVNERGGQVQAPPHAARVGSHDAIGGVRQLEALQQLVGTACDRVRAGPG